MPLWDKTDTTAGRPKFLSAADANKAFFVDGTEAAVPTNIAKGLGTPGWNLYSTYTDSNGNTRHRSETLVAMNVSAAVAGDAADDAIVADDNVAPILTNPTDTAGATNSTASATVDTDHANGTLYWIASTSATAPTVAQIESGQNASGTAAAASGSQAVTATGTQNVSISGLSPSTTYYVHFMHEDSSLNDSSVVSGDGFTTIA